MKKVTVHHHGPVVGQDTVVVDEDGNTFDNVKGVTIYLQAGELPEVTLELNQVDANTEGNVTEVRVVCPCCNALLSHVCKDSQIGDPPDDETKNFLILSLTGTTTGMYAPNGTYIPSAPFDLSGGTVTLKEVKSP